MSSAIAVLTFNRRPVLEALLKGLDTHCQQYPTAIFEDMGLRDDTAEWLVDKKKNQGTYRHDLIAMEHVTGPKRRVFLATKNLGVSGNTNRAIKHFMDETDADHLCIMNDDLIVSGDFVKAYYQAHIDLNIGLFCFCDFTSETYKWVEIPVKNNITNRAYTLKLLPRMTGIMMSVTRKLIEKIGYYDASTFGKWGEEHCDFTNRARFSGAMRVHEQDLHCLDVKMTPPLLQHQEAGSCITPDEKRVHDVAAYRAMSAASRSYATRDWYRPFRLFWPKLAGGHEVGIPVAELQHLPLVIEPTA